jgi:transcriptional regulator with XRE-family HTH domain
METVGKRIRKHREANRAGIREMARSIDISPAYLSRVEHDWPGATPSQDVLHRMASYFGISSDELLSLARRVPPDVMDELARSPEWFSVIREAKKAGVKPDTLWTLAKLLEEPSLRYIPGGS